MGDDFHPSETAPSTSAKFLILLYCRNFESCFSILFGYVYKPFSGWQCMLSGRNDDVRLRSGRDQKSAKSVNRQRKMNRGATN
jgi:hypothetical protein